MRHVRGLIILFIPFFLMSSCSNSNYYFYEGRQIIGDIDWRFTQQDWRRKFPECEIDYWFKTLFKETIKEEAENFESHKLYEVNEYFDRYCIKWTCYWFDDHTQVLIYPSKYADAVREAEKHGIDPIQF